MPLNELVKEYSLRTVSEKTNISTNSLNKLINKEWDKMQEPQVIGFIRIIEREYGIDLSGLEEEARAYYKEHKAKESHNPIDIVGVAEVKSENKIISGLVTLITLAVVAYATWYYVQDHDAKKSQNIEGNGSSSSGMFEETLTSVKSLLGISASSEQNRPKEQNETNSSAVIGEQNRTALVSKKSEQNETVVKEEPKQELSKPIEEHKKFDITAVAQEENNTPIDNVKNSEAESNSSSQESTAAIDAESNGTLVAKSESSSLMSSESNASTNETIVSGSEINNSEESVVLQAQESNISESSESGLEENTTVQSEGKISEITIKPLSKRLWLGIYDLDKKKRINKFITSKITLPVDGNYAIITGHNKLEISGDSLEAMRFPQKGRVYLLVSQNGIKKIDKNEYKSITKNRAW